MDFPYLENALAALARIEEKGCSLDDVLDSLPDPGLRRSTANLLFAFFRRKPAVAAFLKQFTRKPTQPGLRRLLEIAAVQMKFQSAVSPQSAANAAVEYAKRKFGRGEAGFANFFLHRVAEAPLSDFPAAFPEALLTRWRERMTPEELENLTRILATEAPFTFRACGDCQPPPELETTSVSAPFLLPPFRFFSCRNAAGLLHAGLLEKGAIYVQDPAAALAPGLCSGLRDISNILDLCGAPGGKSLLLRELFPLAAFVISDRSEARQKLTLENVRNHKLNARVVTAEAWQLPSDLAAADLVVADVPCSNTGVFRRRPDALSRFSECSLKEVRELQKRILHAAASRVGHGKYLLYATCSIEPEENELAVQDFLAEHPHFTLLKSAALLPSAASDGAFGALLRA